jgi:NADH-quinone oxidoreductase subunit E
MSQVTKLADLPKAKPFVLSAEEQRAIEHEVAHYPDSRAASIEALKIVQKRHGYVPDGAYEPVAKLIGMSAAELFGVATFYSLIFKHPVGRHVIKVCDSLSCYLTGYEDVLQKLQQKLGIGFGQTTGNGCFTLLPICCLGACDKGPVLMIDDDTHGNVTPDGIDKLLEKYV